MIRRMRIRAKPVLKPVSKISHDETAQQQPVEVVPNSDATTVTPTEVFTANAGEFI